MNDKLRALAHEMRRFTNATSEHGSIDAAVVREWIGRLAACPPSEAGEGDRPAGLLGAIARGWCAPENAGKVVDPVLAEAIAREVRALYTATPPAAEVWQPIETAPKDGTFVLLGHMGEFGFIRGTGYFEGGDGAFVSGWISRGLSETFGNLGLGSPTHWSPIPAALRPFTDEGNGNG